MAVCSLFNICVDYIAINVQLVDSFIGFPDSIAQKIFRAVEETGQLDLKHPSVSLEILSLFTTAYADILTALNMSGDHLLLADCLDHILTFTHLSAVDVSCCCLGDNHELLYHISTLKCLKALVLRSNNMTDEGIRKLTAPVRINKTGPLCLQTLDLSENGGVTARSVKFLRVFRELRLLNLCGTAMADPHHQKSVSELESYAKGQSLTMVTPLSSSWEAALTLNTAMTQVITQGWAAGLLNSWRQGQGLHESQSHDLDTGCVRSFYGSSRRRSEKTAAVASCSSRERDRERSSGTNPSSSLILITDFLIHPSRPTSTISDTHTGRPRGDQTESQGDTRCMCGGEQETHTQRSVCGRVGQPCRNIGDECMCEDKGHSRHNTGDRCVCGEEQKGHAGKSLYDGVGHPHHTTGAAGERDRDTQRSRATGQAQISGCEAPRTKRGRHDSHDMDDKVNNASPWHTKKVRVERDRDLDVRKSVNISECGDDDLMLLQQYGYTG